MHIPTPEVLVKVSFLGRQWKEPEQGQRRRLPRRTTAVCRGQREGEGEDGVDTREKTLRFQGAPERRLRSVSGSLG